MTPFLEFSGRLHLLLLHLPIGIFVGIACLETIALFTGTPVARRVLRGLASDVPVESKHCRRLACPYAPDEAPEEGASSS